MGNEEIIDDILIDFEVNNDQKEWNNDWNDEVLAYDWWEEWNKEDNNNEVVGTSAQGIDNDSENRKYGISSWPNMPHRWPREMYEWKDKLAKKMRLTKVQYDFVQNYLKTGNASQAIREANGGVVKVSDRVVGYNMKNNTRINQYIQETAMDCAQIQYDQIIKNEKAPMAVRNDAIKDRLDRAGVWAKFEAPESTGNMFVGNMTITVEK